MNILNVDISIAKALIADLLLENPDFGLWKSISAQLEFIADDFDEDGNFKNSANVENVKKIILGLQSIREIEPGNPELSDLLCEIDYQYKKLYFLE
jgi:hypothetical protein